MRGLNFATTGFMNPFVQAIPRNFQLKQGHQTPGKSLLLSGIQTSGITHWNNDCSNVTKKKCFI